MQVYGAILPGAASVARVLPRTAAATRVEPILSAQARHRLKFIRWYEEHQRNARMTCRHFSLSPSTFYLWLHRYERQGLPGLEDCSCRPQRVREPTWSEELAEAVFNLREEHPRWGKDKLVVLLRRQGREVSTSMVGRILRRLKEHGVLVEAPRVAVSTHKRPHSRPYAVRKPKEYAVRRPGDLVQVDTLDLRPLPGVVLKHFTARDVVSRWDVLEVHRFATAATASHFLDALEGRMPFEVRAIQVDGGSEYQAEFERECERRGIRLFVLPPRSPKLNGHVERAHRTHTEEFYEVADLSWAVGEIKPHLLAWERVYNTLRPHQALDYRTPLEFCQHWSAQQRTERG
jgi:putative transposase